MCACVFYTHRTSLASVIDAPLYEGTVIALLLAPTCMFVVWLGLSGKPLFATTHAELRQVLISAEDDASGGVATVQSPVQ